MRFLIQRCSQAEVIIDGRSRGRLGRGLVVFFGVGQKPATAAGAQQGEGTLPALPLMPLEESVTQTVQALSPMLDRCIEKILGLRVFSDALGKMNLGMKEAQGGLYLVSQFTLFADSRKGFRPSFTRAAPAAVASRFFELLVERATLAASGLPVYSGEFAADMGVSLVNDGPVTILLDADSKGFLP
ncbi:MAG: D-tyrosyl-tRNA(Tyr) deacylase [Silvanigrellales bacterium]|nr:D-tyrosyl-tRNA(Tyr) deacylase [Silvanigrellales bacterium]